MAQPLVKLRRRKLPVLCLSFDSGRRPVSFYQADIWHFFTSSQFTTGSCFKTPGKLPCGCQSSEPQRQSASARVPRIPLREQFVRDASHAPGLRNKFLVWAQDGSSGSVSVWTSKWRSVLCYDTIRMQDMSLSPKGCKGTLPNRPQHSSPDVPQSPCRI